MSPLRPAPWGAPNSQSARLTFIPEIVGESPAVQRLLQMIKRVAPTEHPLLLCGPTGSGKEVLARQAHHHSHVSAEPFVDINCAAIPENLIESELFGHVKGAFTGATGNRPGHFQQVGRGTLFLDEIGELPLALQPKLLRVLETRSFRPVGGTETLHFAGRLIAATHRDLPAMIRAGRFREDLYYRLAVFVLHLPGLEQRREDIPALVRHFAARQARPLTFTAGALKCLSQHNWPGHIRQLRNLVEQLSVLADSSEIGSATLAPYLTPDNSPPASLDELADTLLQLDGPDKLAAVERLMVDRALLRSAGNKTAAAQLLGVNRKIIERRLKNRHDSRQQAVMTLERATRMVDESDFRAAIPLLHSCLRLLPEDDGDDELRQQAFTAHRLLGICLRAVNGWLCGEAQASSEAAIRIGQSLGKDEELVSLQFGVWTAQLMKLDLCQARATAQTMLLHAQTINRPVNLDEAHVAMANTLFWLGDSEETLACLARRQLQFPGSNSERLGTQGFDLAGLALTFAGLAAFQLGDFTRARQAMEHLIERAGKPHRNAFNRAIYYQGSAWLACLFEDHDRLGILASALEQLAREHGFTFYCGVGRIFQGCHLGGLGRFAEAEQTMVEGYENEMLRHGGLLFHSFQAWQRGKILLSAGQPKACENLVNHALEMALEKQERAYLAELMSIRACAMLAQGDRDGAEQELRNALSTAQVLGSVPARLAASTHLAQLLKQSRRPAQASETLLRALRGIKEAATSPETVRAQQLLAELRSPD